MFQSSKPRLLSSGLCLAKVHQVIALTTALSGAVFLGVSSAYAQGVSAASPGGFTPVQDRTETTTGGGQPGEVTTDSGTNTANGNKQHSIPVLGWTARGGLPVSLTLYNNSQGTNTSELGKGWSHTFNVYLLINPATQAATVSWGDGTNHPYAKDASGNYVAPTGIYSTLTYTTSGSAVTSYTVTTKAGVKYLFSAATGNVWRLASITDRNGNALIFAFNSADFVTSITDPTGRALSFTYDASNKLTKVTDPLSHEYTFTYNGAGDLSQVTYPSVGNVTPTVGFGYDANRRVTSITDPRGNASTYSYDSAGALQWEKDALNHQTTYTYGSGYTDITDARGITARDIYTNGKRTSHVEAGNTSTSFTTAYTYDNFSNVSQMIDALGKTWNFNYDNRGNLLTTTDPLSHTTTYTYNNLDKPLTVTTPGNRVASFTYDANGNKLTETNPLGKTVTYSYGSWGQVLSVTNALNYSVTYSYDANGYVASVTDPLSHGRTYTYDALGHKLTDANGTRTTSWAYDALGRVTSTTSPNNHTTTFGYDAVGNRTSVTNPLNQTDTSVYDAANRLTSHTDGNQITVSFGYDANGNKTTFTDGRGKVTSYTYNSRNLLASIGYPDSTGESFTYNANGKMLTQTDGRGIVTSMSYDDAGKQVGQSYSNNSAPSVAFVYDIDSRKTSMTETAGTTTTTTSYTYDNAGRLLSRTAPQGSISYTYDDAGQKVSQTVNGTTTTYGYNAAGLLTSATVGTSTTSYTYNTMDFLDSITYPNGVTAGYDNAGGDEVLGTFFNSSGVAIAQYNYQYDALHRLISRSRDGQVMATFTYDGAGRLQFEGRTGPDGYYRSYTYDASGNRVAKSTQTSAGTVSEYYTFDDANKLLTVGSAPTTVDKAFTYDNAGNTASVTTGAGTTNLAWDGANRLVGITYPNNATNSFSYNGLGQRIGKIDISGSFVYTLAGDAINSPVLSDGAATYNFGLGIMSEVRGGAVRYYHPDTQGTTRMTTDASGNVSSSLETDPFGIAWAPMTTGVQSPFGYAGQHGYQSDEQSGLMRVGYRYYDASTGRFISRDPIQDGNNWYVYCGNNPVNAVDPDGLFYISIGGSVTGAIGVVGKWVSAEINIGDGGIGVSVHVGGGVGYSHNVVPFAPSISAGPVIGFNRGDVPRGQIAPEVVATGYIEAKKGIGLTLSSPVNDLGFPSVAVSGQVGPTVGGAVLVGGQTGVGAAIPIHIPMPWDAPSDMWGRKY